MNAMTQPDSQIESLVQKLLERCLNRASSDLHIEPEPEGYRCRARTLGRLQCIQNLNAMLAPRLIAHIKVQAKLDITERRLPQDGRCCFNLRRQILYCRVSTLPTLGGEKLVLRILSQQADNTKLAGTGLLPSQQLQVESALQRKEGLILTTGPTGSGKTQTLYTLLQQLNDEQRNISTVEDPVEVDLAGINQVSVQPVLGFTFAHALRALMRQDPDIIMVGEIRDQETASIACQAAQTGHLVLATLHAASPLNAIIRLQQLGIDGYQLAACLVLLMNQRLITVSDSHRMGVYELVTMQHKLQMALLANPNQAHYWEHIAEAARTDISLSEATEHHLKEPSDESPVS